MIRVRNLRMEVTCGRIYSLRTRLTRVNSPTAAGASARNETMLHDGSACTKVTSATAAEVCGFSLLTLSAGPLGEASREPDIVENGAVKGDTISMMSRKAASLPSALQRTVTGVMNRTDGCRDRLFKIDAMRARGFFEETMAIGSWKRGRDRDTSYILV